MTQGYLTMKVVFEKWNITQRQAQILCKGKRILGAVQMSRIWLISESIEKPTGKKK